MSKSSANTLEIHPFVEEELELCHRSKAPKSKKDCMDLFVFDKSTVNKDSLKRIVSLLKPKHFVNVHKIFLLTESQIEDCEYEELEMCDTEGLLFEGKVAIHNLETGSIIVNLNAHIEEGMGNFERGTEVILSILHEIRHAQQFEESHRYYPHIIESFSRKFSFTEPSEINLDKMEKDAEKFAHKQMDKIIKQIAAIDFERLCHWGKVQSESYEG